MEQERDEFYEKIRDGYLKFAKRQKDRVVVIKGWESPADIADQIWEILSKRFPDLAKTAS